MSERQLNDIEVAMLLDLYYRPALTEVMFTWFLIIHVTTPVGKHWPDLGRFNQTERDDVKL